MIVFLGNSGNIDGAPTIVAAFYAVALVACGAMTWTFIWFVLMPFGITQANPIDWAFKGLTFYFLLFGLPIWFSLREEKKDYKE